MRRPRLAVIGFLLASACADGPSYATIHGLLQSANDTDRRVAAKSQSALKELDEDAVGVVIRALDDSSAAIRRRAAETLGMMKGQSKKATKPLMSHMGDPDDSVGTLSVIALGHLGSLAAESRDTIHELATKTGPLRAAALYALPNIDTEAHSFFGIYADAARDSSEAVRIAAIKNVLAGARGPEHSVVPIVRRALHDQSDSVTVAGLVVAQLLRGAAREILPEVLRLKHSPNPSVRLAADSAALAIAGIPPK